MPLASARCEQIADLAEELVEPLGGLGVGRVPRRQQQHRERAIADDVLNVSTTCARSCTCGGGALGSSTSMRWMRARRSAIAWSRIESNTAALLSKYR